jgi:hypothetical protein
VSKLPFVNTIYVMTDWRLIERHGLYLCFLFCLWINFLVWSISLFLIENLYNLLFLF